MQEIGGIPMKKILSILLVFIFLFAFTSCKKEVDTEPITEQAQTTEKETTTEEPTVVEPTEKETTSETTTMKTYAIQSITVNCTSKTADGKLLTKCSAASNGQNIVPGITWTKVDGAACYALYILDTSANNWMHMKATATATEIKEGSSIQGQYKGPYPPSGNHTYVIYVLALDKAPSSLPGNFDSTNQGIDSLKTQINANILGYGQTQVTYANGDVNVK